MPDGVHMSGFVDYIKFFSEILKYNFILFGSCSLNLLNCNKSIKSFVERQPDNTHATLPQLFYYFIFIIYQSSNLKHFISPAIGNIYVRLIRFYHIKYSSNKYSFHRQKSTISDIHESPFNCSFEGPIICLMPGKNPAIIRNSSFPINDNPIVFTSSPAMDLVISLP